MEKAKTKKLNTALISLALCFALLFLSEYFPVFVLGVPLIAAFGFVSCGYYYGAGISLVGFAAGLLLGFSMSLYIAVAFLPVIIIASYAIIAQKRFRTSIIMSTAAALTGVAIVILMLTLKENMTIVEYTVAYLGDQLSLFSDSDITILYGASRSADLISGAITQAAIEATPAADAIINMQEALREALNLSIVYILIIYSIVIGYFTYILPRAVAKKRKHIVPDIPKFRDYALPKRFWIAAAATFLAALIGDSFGWKGFEILLATLYSVYVFVFMIQGLCLLAFWLAERKMSKAKSTIIFIVAVIFLSAIALPIAGLFENIFGLRKRMKARKADVH